jgi:hypothetical protein
VTFRDDHDAALARADALEAEVERKDSELAKAKKRADTNEEEIARLRAENEKLRAATPKARKSVPATPVREPPRPQPVPMDESTRQGAFASSDNPLLAFVVLLVILAGLGATAYVLVKGPSKPDKTEVQPR